MTHWYSSSKPYWGFIVQIVLIALVLSVSSSLTAAYAATIEFSGDAIIGVSGLEFLDSEYDAIFYNGSYEDLLTGYPAPPNATDYSSSFASTATNALYDFVITAAFDGIAPEAINGCTNLSLCYIATAVEQNSGVAAFVEYRASVSPASGSSSRFAADDVNYSNASWVVWKEAGAISPVPVPASAWLFGSALGLLGWARRRTI